MALETGGQEDEFVSAAHDPPLAALTMQVVEAIRTVIMYPK